MTVTATTYRDKPCTVIADDGKRVRIRLADGTVMWVWSSQVKTA